MSYLEVQAVLGVPDSPPLSFLAHLSLRADLWHRVTVNKFWKHNTTASLLFLESSSIFLFFYLISSSNSCFSKAEPKHTKTQWHSAVRAELLMSPLRMQRKLIKHPPVLPRLLRLLPPSPLPHLCLQAFHFDHWTLGSPACLWVPGLRLALGHLFCQALQGGQEPSGPAPMSGLESGSE